MAKINNIKYLIVKCKVYLLGSAFLLISIFLRLNTPNNLKIDYGKKTRRKKSVVEKKNNNTRNSLCLKIRVRFRYCSMPKVEMREEETDKGRDRERDRIAMMR